MEWARTNTVRGIVVAMLVAFVVVQVVQRDWAWLAAGVALLLLNLVLWREHRRASSEATGEGSSKVTTDVDSTLAELLDLPGVADAWAAAPPVWRQVSYLDDGEDLSLPAAEVAEFVWVVCSDGEWSIGVGDELKPVLDLDCAEDQDALVSTVAAHPAVAAVHHSDREQYDVVLHAPVSLADLAALAAHGLVAHHLEAVRRLTAQGDQNS